MEPSSPEELVMQTFYLYQTKAKHYLVGHSKCETSWRVLALSRTEPGGLEVFEDPTIYSKAEAVSLLKQINDGNLAHGGLSLICKAYGVIGCFRLYDGGYYLLLVSKRRYEGSICGHHVYGIAEKGLVQLTHPAVQARESSAERRYRRLLLSGLDLTRSFYFSYTYRLHRSLQDNCLDGGCGGDAFDGMYVWNEFLTRPLRESLGNSRWVLGLVHGFWQQRRLSLFGRSLTLTLLARRSKYFAGTRYRKRGVNDEGHVANEVETEQLVFLDDHIGTRHHQHHPGGPSGVAMSGVVQVRGSIPLYWTQEGSTLKPDIVVQQYDPLYRATAAHFDDLYERYGGPTVVLNLVKQVEKRAREGVLRNEFTAAIGYLNARLPYHAKVQYNLYDLHYHARRRGCDVMSDMNPMLSVACRAIGLFLCLPPAPGNKGAPPTVQLQRGVLRTNCIDCLDRTNVGQFGYGLAALGSQLAALGVSDCLEIDRSSSVARQLMDMYEAMGHTLAMQYGGSDAHSSFFQRQRGDWEAATTSRDLMTSLRRIYSNTYTDAEKQDAINLFLGNFQPSNGRPHLWDLDSDVYLHTGRGRADGGRGGSLGGSGASLMSAGGSLPSGLVSTRGSGFFDLASHSHLPGPRTFARQAAAAAVGGGGGLQRAASPLERTTSDSSGASSVAAVGGGGSGALDGAASFATNLLARAFGGGGAAAAAATTDGARSGTKAALSGTSSPDSSPRGEGASHSGSSGPPAPGTVSWATPPPGPSLGRSHTLAKTLSAPPGSCAALPPARLSVWAGLGAPPQPAGPPKLESFDKVLQPVQQAGLYDAPAAQRGAYLPSWLSSPLMLGQRSRRSSDAGGVLDSAAGGGSPSHASGSPAAALRRASLDSRRASLDSSKARSMASDAAAAARNDGGMGGGGLMSPPPGSPLRRTTSDTEALLTEAAAEAAAEVAVAAAEAKAVTVACTRSPDLVVLPGGGGARGGVGGLRSFPSPGGRLSQRAVAASGAGRRYGSSFGGGDVAGGAAGLATFGESLPSSPLASSSYGGVAHGGRRRPSSAGEGGGRSRAQLSLRSGGGSSTSLQSAAASAQQQQQGGSGGGSGRPRRYKAMFPFAIFRQQSRTIAAMNIEAPSRPPPASDRVGGGGGGFGGANSSRDAARPLDLASLMEGEANVRAGRDTLGVSPRVLHYWRNAGGALPSNGGSGSGAATTGGGGGAPATAPVGPLGALQEEEALRDAYARYLDAAMSLWACCSPDVQRCRAERYACLCSPGLIVSLDGFYGGKASEWRKGAGLHSSITLAESELRDLAEDELGAEGSPFGGGGGGGGGRRALPPPPVMMACQ